MNQIEQILKWNTDIKIEFNNNHLNQTKEIIISMGDLKNQSKKDIKKYIDFLVGSYSKITNITRLNNGKI